MIEWIMTAGGHLDFDPGSIVVKVEDISDSLFLAIGMSNGKLICRELDSTDVEHHQCLINGDTLVEIE